ncbi:uncharacterized protein LOC116906157 [Rattus rattus]|uniref:uncharacterized protein LOC116906157 n=1 Tax=Rattus rattus TaxID=10117 RepID=UPI0013F33A29|nr:uncharacterized protein LOC116906157 [Rattus rattus]
MGSASTLHSITVGDFFFLGSFELSPCAPTPLFTPKGEQGVSDCIFPRAGWGLGRGFPNRCSTENGGSRWGQRGGARSRGAGGAGGCRVLRAAALAAGSQPWPRRLLGEEVTTAPSREQQSLSLRVALACVPRPLGATQGSSVQSRTYTTCYGPATCGHHVLWTLESFTSMETCRLLYKRLNAYQLPSLTTRPHNEVDFML